MKEQGCKFKIDNFSNATNQLLGQIKMVEINAQEIHNM